MIPPSPKKYNAAVELIVRNLVPRRAAKVAYIDEGGKYTYAELAERVGQCANALKSHSGSLTAPRWGGNHRS
ncbi:MAG TPA: hypothetical protein VE988_27835 [Gemmataceae bacterium]|nr:hypothetical protein [Gemmataceae bacterium]